MNGTDLKIYQGDYTYIYIEIHICTISVFISVLLSLISSFLCN